MATRIRRIVPLSHPLLGLGHWVGPPQDRDLIAQHENLRVLAASLRARSTSQPKTRTMRSEASAG